MVVIIGPGTVTTAVTASSSRLESAIRDLRILIGDRLSTSAAVREQHGHDEGHLAGAPPDAVVFPASTEEVVEIVRTCARHRVPMTAFGTGTGLEGNVAALEGGQQPPAIILSCADSRVVPEMVFDTGLGELFVIRVAGNVASLKATGVKYGELAVISSSRGTSLGEVIRLDGTLGGEAVMTARWSMAAVASSGASAAPTLRVATPVVRTIFCS